MPALTSGGATPRALPNAHRKSHHPPILSLVHNSTKQCPTAGRTRFGQPLVDGRVASPSRTTGVGRPGRRQRISIRSHPAGAQGTGLGPPDPVRLLSGLARCSLERAGPGTTFRALVRGQHPRGRAPSPPPEPAPTTESLRCLIVDDEEAVGGVLGDILETNGHAVVVLTSGAEAVERFRAESFDVVFTDLAMPGLSGWQVARGVKAVAPAVPVFLVTGFGVELSAAEQRENGVDRVLTKPLSIQLVPTRRVRPRRGLESNRVRSWGHHALRAVTLRAPTPSDLP